jgi:hypothetical protein
VIANVRLVLSMMSSTIVQVPEEAQQFKAGFPPKPLCMDLDAIDAWGLQNGDALVLQSSPNVAAPAAALVASTPSSTPNQILHGRVAGVLPDGRCDKFCSSLCVHACYCQLPRGLRSVVMHAIT